MAKKITEKRLYNIALYYLSRYEATTGKVRDVLKRRLMTAERRGEEIPNEAPAWIEKIRWGLVTLALGAMLGGTINVP